MPKKKRARFTERSHKCGDCGKRFKFQSQLTNHERMHSGEKPYECDVCGKSFRQQGTLSNHQKLHTGERAFVCPWPECGKSFSSKANLQAHEARHSGERSFACLLCERSFYSASELKSHEIRHENHSQFKCANCGKSFGSEASLRRHEDSAEGLACIPNLSASASGWLLARCQKKGDKPYICRRCGKGFSQRSGLYVHSKLHLNGGRKLFKCLECDKNFSTKASLQQHQLRHGSQRNFVCDRCPRAFYTAGELRQHIIRHELREKYKCPLCARGYPTEADLQTHEAHAGGCEAAALDEKTINLLLMRSHSSPGSSTSEPKEWPCQYCDRVFKYKSYMQSHERIHTGERPFKCAKCEKRFRYHSSLWNHSRRCGLMRARAEAKSRPERGGQGGVGLFPCDLCARPFIRLAALNAHKHKVHGAVNGDGQPGTPGPVVKTEPGLTIETTTPLQPPQQQFNCFCGRTFSYESQLKSHLRTHTGERPYKCRYCDKAFTQKPTLQNHERTHTGEKPFKCRYCELQFGQYSARATHENAKHLGSQCYKCEYCAKTLSSPSALYAHRKLHQDKQFECDQCGKLFALNNYLKQHVRNVHAADKPPATPRPPKINQCEHCGKVFPHPSSLYVHRRIHTGERPFKCGHCDKTFVSQGNMQAHERTHTGERPYQCPANALCLHKGYTQKIALKAHMARCMHYRSMTQQQQQQLNGNNTIPLIQPTNGVSLKSDAASSIIGSLPVTPVSTGGDVSSSSSGCGGITMTSDDIMAPPTMITPPSWLSSIASTTLTNINPDLLAEFKREFDGDVNMKAEKLN